MEREHTPIIFDSNGLDPNRLSPERRALFASIKQDPEAFIRDRLSGYQKTGVREPIEWFLCHYNDHSFPGLNLFRRREDPPSQNGIDQESNV